MTEAQEAALRLRSELPVRFHYRAEKRLPDAPLIGVRGHRLCPVIVNGNTYRSSTLAAKGEGVSYATIRSWIHRGKARILRP
jgi:hypothetical protein